MKNEFYFSKILPFAFFLLSVALIVSLTPFFASPAHATLKAKLYKGDKVEVKIGCQINTDTLKVGTQFRAKVRTQFEKGGDIYIYEGDPVFATVESVKKRGWYGKGAELIVRFDSTLSSGGTFIPLKGQLPIRGKNRKTLAYLLFFMGWAIKGKNVQTTGEEPYATEVPVDIIIEIKP